MMKQLQLKRTYLERCTVGLLVLPSETALMTLERPWMGNIPFTSCIPEGVYEVYRDDSGKHQWYRFNPNHVHPRTDIEIHPANTVGQLSGCIALGTSVAKNAKQEHQLYRSRYACQTFLEEMGDTPFLLEITS